MLGLWIATTGYAPKNRKELGGKFLELINPSLGMLEGSAVAINAAADPAPAAAVATRSARATCTSRPEFRPPTNPWVPFWAWVHGGMVGPGSENEPQKAFLQQGPNWQDTAF